MRDFLVLTSSSSQIYYLYRSQPEEAVEKFVKYLDNIAFAEKDQFALYREGHRISLHYQGFSCSNEQRFADTIDGDRGG